MQFIRGFFRKSASADLASIRQKYKDKTDVFLEDNIMVKEPLDLFKIWLNEAYETPEILEPNAMCLATASRNGIPSARFVLLKEFNENGFVFFTNYESRKAQDINVNPNVALTFYWFPLHRSVRIEGVASKIDRAESQKYFHERPLSSQISAAISPQSQRIPSRAYLEALEDELKGKLDANENVPLPNWGGYLVKPHRIEFWQGQTNRLHDRIQFRRSDGCEDEIDGELVKKGENGWVLERLAP